MRSTETATNTCNICGRTLTAEPNFCGSDCGGDCLHCMCFVVEDPDCLVHKLSCKEINPQLEAKMSGAFLAENSYGKSSVRLVKVKRDAPMHTLKEWKVEVLLFGDFETCFTVGDNSDILPTDTMKNTVYSRARESSAESIEDFAAELAEFLLSRNPQVERVVINIASTPWEHVISKGEVHASTFTRGTAEAQTTAVTYSREGVSVTSGLENLVLLKTANSGFEGFIRDSLTTLPETADRLFGTAMRAQWKYQSVGLPYEQLRAEVRAALIDVFADHDSKSVQHTLYAMARAALEAVPEILDVELAMPNKHCLLVDLSRFGQTNPNEIFVPTDEPYGNIVARIRRETKGS